MQHYHTQQQHQDLSSSLLEEGGSEDYSILYTDKGNNYRYNSLDYHMAQAIFQEAL